MNWRFWNRCEAGCNPLGMWPGKPEWEGEITDETGVATRAQFRKAVFGFRAGGTWIMRKSDGPNANTLNGILASWPPWRSDKYVQNPSAYLAMLSSLTGWRLDQEFKPKSYADAYTLLYAICIAENGTLKPFKPWQITDGLRRTGISDVPPTLLRRNITFIGTMLTAAAGVAPFITAWLDANNKLFESLNSPWALLTFKLLQGAGAGLALLGIILQRKRQGV